MLTGSCIGLSQVPRSGEDRLRRNHRLVWPSPYLLAPSSQDMIRGEEYACACQCWIWREIAKDNCLLRCIVFMLQARLAELVSAVVLQRRVVPFPLRFQEQGERITPKHGLVSFRGLRSGMEYYPICVLLLTALKTPVYTG